MYAKRAARWCLSVTTLMVLAGWSGLSLAQEKKPEQPKPKDIVEVAKNTADLKTFSKLIESAGLVETLQGKGPYTVFAPTDEAFAKLGKRLEELQKPENKAELQRILKYHVLEGRWTVTQFKSMKFAKTLIGAKVAIAVTNDVVTIDTAKVTKADTEASNGLIQVVDTVLTPPAVP
jgi:uncharacterized surface protein with fasciclin (FAS1) repeats